MSAEPEIVRGRRVLELGTGLGIAGIAGGGRRRPARFLSDIDASAVRLALKSHEELGRSPGRVSGARVDFARGGWPAAVRAGADNGRRHRERRLYSERQAPPSPALADYSPTGRERVCDEPTGER